MAFSSAMDKYNMYIKFYANATFPIIIRHSKAPSEICNVSCYPNSRTICTSFVGAFFPKCIHEIYYSVNNFEQGQRLCYNFRNESNICHAAKSQTYLPRKIVCLAYGLVYIPSAFTNKLLLIKKVMKAPCQCNRAT